MPEVQLGFGALAFGLFSHLFSQQHRAPVGHAFETRGRDDDGSGSAGWYGGWYEVHVYPPHSASSQHASRQSVAVSVA